MYSVSWLDEAYTEVNIFNVGLQREWTIVKLTAAVYDYSQYVDN